MDVSKFNKELGKRIQLATLHENRGEIQEAIKSWFEISEMTLRASKTPNIKFPFKNMLLKKTEQIIEHIKMLKSKSFGIKKEEIYIKDFDKQQDVKPVKHQNDLNTPSPRKEVENSKIEDEMGPSHYLDDISDSEFKNIPDGFKEIQASKGFKILTPHDPKEIIERLEQAEKQDMSIFKPPNSDEHEMGVENIQENIELDEFSEEGSKICPFCGQGNHQNSSACKGCGSKIN